MSIIQAIILGFVQGASEFLPISSSGHLAILENLFGLKNVGLAFDVLLHTGTLIAVCIVFYKDILGLIIAFCQIVAAVVRNIILFFRKLFARGGEKMYLPGYERVINSTYRRFALMAIITTIPAAVLGVLLQDFIDSFCSGLLIPGIFLLLTGVVLLIAEMFTNGTKTVKTMSYPNALAIGFAQACALFPGLSRSGSTITAGLVYGLNKKFAVRYSFICSIPIVLGATLKTLLDVIKGEDVSGVGAPQCIVGMIVAGVVGYIAIRFFLSFINKGKYRYFSIYCFAVGLLAIIASFFVN